MDDFFKRKTCQRCGGLLTGGRTMSRFNEDCICMDCAKKEKEHPRYKEAVEAEMAAIKQGNMNFPGIGL